MSQPSRWHDEANPNPQRRLVALAAAVPAIPVDLHTWDDVLARSAITRSTPRLLPSFVLSAIAGLTLVLLTRAVFSPPPAQTTAPSPVLMASETTRWRQGSDGVVVLEVGRLALPTPSAQWVRVKTPHVSIEAQRSRFLAEVVVNGTVISVEEGEVVVRMGGQERRLRAGDTLTWPPAPDLPNNLLVRPIELGCSEVGGDARRACLTAEARGDDLAAQAALSDLGALELRAGHPAAARAAWLESLERFGDGVLHPEVRLALLVEQVRARDFGAALQTARDFEVRCADDARVDDVRKLRIALEALPR